MLKFFKSIKFVELLFFPAIGFLGYVAYQDYVFRQYISEQPKNDPISKLERNHKRFYKCQNIKQLRWIYEKSYDHLYTYMNYPEIENSKVSDLKYQVMRWTINQQMKKYINHYQQSTTYIQGNLYIFLWNNYCKEFIRSVKPANKEISIIYQQINNRQSRCEQIAKILTQKIKVVPKDKQYLECIRTTEPIVTNIKRQLEIYKNLKNSDKYFKKSDISKLM